MRGDRDGVETRHLRARPEQHDHSAGESAIVLVTAWGIWRLRERRGAWLRIGGALIILVGIGLLTTS